MAKVQVSILGMPRAGKTTVLGLLSCACDIRGHSDSNFYHDIIEHSSGIRAVPDRMRAGYFPERTPPGRIYEADFILKWRKRIGFDTLVLPTVETAGEDVDKLIEAINKGEYQTNERTKYEQWADSFYATILDSVGFIIIVPCDGIRGISIPQSTDDVTLPSADLSITRLISNIMEYKQWTGSKKVQGIAIIFTKYDLISGTMKREGIDLASADERVRQTCTDNFMKKYMSSMFNLLRFHEQDIKDTVYLPSWVNLAVKDGVVALNSDGSPKIAVDFRTRQPQFSNYYFQIGINWLRSTFIQ